MIGNGSNPGPRPKLRLILAANPDWADLSAEWKEDESWQAIAEAKPRLLHLPEIVKLV